MLYLMKMTAVTFKRRQVETPTSGSLVASPLIVEGKALGTWFFEGSMPVEILDEQGNVLAQWYVTSQGDWMTAEFVDFKGEIEFVSPKAQTGKLVIKKDNPSDMREFDASCFVPILLPQTETMIVKVFFNNDQLDPEFSCNKVFSVERVAPKTEAVARVALEELLKGASESEQADGYLTSINPGVEIQSLVIENGVAYVDFSEQLEYQVGGSCRVSAIHAQITETLKQFPTVDEVLISVDGRTEDILQP